MTPEEKKDMGIVPIPEPRKLPTIAEIVASEKTDLAKTNDLNVLLNQPPPESWLKAHPMASGVKYIPIDKIELLLTKIFIKWNVEVRQVQCIANSAVVTVRLFYKDPFSDEMLWQDGVGAAPIQTDKGAGAMDWNAAKNDGVMKAAPAAKSYAIKDAAECIGKIFGKDLNRKDTLVYNGLLNDDRFKNATITEK